MNSLEEVQEMFKHDRYATDNGCIIEAIDDHYARCSLKLDEHHFNAVGSVMGGVYFTLADFTFAVASNWQKAGTVSLSSNITFLGATKGDTLYAEAICVKDGRTTCYYRIDVYDNLNTKIAAVTTTGYHK